MINLQNLEKVTCPRCKGNGFIRGQRTSSYSLPNYKFNENGLCFACMGEKYLRLSKEGFYLREEKGNILKYDFKGKYLGIYEYKEEKPFVIRTKEEIEEEELNVRRTLLYAYIGRLSREEVLTELKSISIQRRKYSRKLHKKNNIRDLEVFLTTIIDCMDKTNKMLSIISKREDCKDEVRRLYNHYERHANTEIELFTLKLNKLYK